MLRRFLLLAGLMAIAAPALATGSAPSSLHLTMRDTNTTVSVRNGGTITVTLSEQPGTGYAYRSQISPPAIIGQPTRSMGPAAAPGAMQLAVYTFRALSPGTATISMHSRGPSGQPGTRWPPFTVTVRVVPR